MNALDIYIFHNAHTRILPVLNGRSESLNAHPVLGFEWWLEIDVGLHCPFDFSYYPFDTQACRFMISSMAATKETLIMHTAAVIDETAEVQQTMSYKIGYVQFKRPEDFFFVNAVSKKNFSLSGFDMKMSRQLQSTLANVFLPSFLTVVTASIRNISSPDLAIRQLVLFVADSVGSYIYSLNASLDYAAIASGSH